MDFLKTKLYGYQEEAMEFALSKPNVALWMEQGTGKTLVTIATIGRRYLDGEVKRVLVVAPKAVLPVWRWQFKEHCRLPMRIALLGEELKVKEKKEVLSEWEDTRHLGIAILNFESARVMEKEIRKWKPDVIVVDESQRIKNGTALQSKVFHRLGTTTKHCMALSGNPIPESPLDYWSQYRFLDPKVFGKKWPKFRDQYSYRAGFGGWDRKIKTHKLKQLSGQAYSIAYRITKDEALDLPPQVDQVMYCYLGGQSQKVYRDMKKEFLVTLMGKEIEAEIVLTQMLRLQQITGGFITHTNEDTGKKKNLQVGTEKLDLLKEILMDIPPHKKVVIFVRFLPDIKAIAKVVKKAGRTVVKFTGKTKKKGKIVRDFQTKRDPQVFVAQIRTGGLGLDLFAADTAIFFSPDFSYGNYEQARARVHRIGQTADKVTYIHLVAKGTVDEVILKALREKRDMAEVVLEHYRKLKKKNSS